MLSKWVKLFFIIWTIIEIAVFIGIGFLIGFGWAILLLILSIAAGIGLIRTKGFKSMHGLKQGQMPGMSFLQNFNHIIVGIFLIIPGFLSSIFGLFLFIPAIRKKLMGMIFRRLITGQFSGMNFGAANHANPQSAGRTHDIDHGRTIDGDVEKDH